MTAAANTPRSLLESSAARVRAHGELTALVGGGIWFGCRYALAAGVTAAALAIVPVLVVTLVGGALFVFWALMIPLLSLGADPPILGFLIASSFTALSAVATIVAVLVVCVAAILWSVAIVTPLAIALHLVLRGATIGRCVARFALLGVAGAILGVGLGMALQLALARATPGLRGDLAVSGAYAIAWTFALASTAIYASVLLALDAARAFVGWASTRWSARLQAARAR